jgi:hypothetical protein
MRIASDNHWGKSTKTIESKVAALGLSIMKPTVPEAIVYKGPAATIAPVHCAIMYGAKFGVLNHRSAHNPKEATRLNGPSSNRIGHC